MAQIPITDRLHSGKMLYFDGGTGSILQENGLMPGELPERWNLTHADFIQKLHENYYKAGANIIKTDTFGLNCLKFEAEELTQIV
ncbi:MAG: homocysteine S-methyltransferase family protein, partial [Lachnospiraceae bacterium]|nr:homocysteine S-methyltransferase family protein [Lachnospiraceae bacterium]